MKSDFSSPLLRAGGNLEMQMIDKFYGGGGGWWLHPSGSQLGRALAESGAVEDTVQMASWQCMDQLIAGKKVKDLRVNIGTPNFFPLRNAHLARALYGGTSGMKLILSDVKWSPPAFFGLKQPTLSGKITFHLSDVFGLDHDDTYHYYLLAMWILQHERRGPQPFFNKTIFTKSFYADGAKVHVGDR